MQAAMDLWPTCFIGFCAYPFIAIPYYRRRRFLVELAQIGHDERIETIAQATRVLVAFQMQLRADIAAEYSPTQEP